MDSGGGTVFRIQRLLVFGEFQYNLGFVDRGVVGFWSFGECWALADSVDSVLSCIPRMLVFG